MGHLVCGVAVSADDAVTQTASSDPDVILMDIRLRGPESGIDAARRIKAAFGKRCIFISAMLVKSRSNR
jgi:DNA-binding NarL/FixJ family response regulator